MYYKYSSEMVGVGSLLTGVGVGFGLKRRGRLHHGSSAHLFHIWVGYASEDVRYDIRRAMNRAQMTASCNTITL